MGFADLFKSKKEREREQRREQRANERQAERGLARMGQRIKKLEKERTLVWQKARELVLSGHKDEAGKLVSTYKILGVQINCLEKQRLVIQNKLNNVATAGDLSAIVGAMARYAEGMDVDAEGVQEGLDAVTDVEGEIAEVNQVVNGAFDEDVAKAGETAEAQRNEVTDDELMSALEREAAAEVSGGKVGLETSGENINSGRDRLRALLKEK